jgi:hypothetical protein
MRYYTFALTKAGVTKDVYAKFSYVFRMTHDGVKIVTHNSGITPKGAVERVPAPKAEHKLVLAVADIRSAVATWVRCASSRDIEAMLQLYHPQSGRLLGTVDNAADPRRTSIELIREYFEHFLGGHTAVVPTFPAFDERDICFLSGDQASYSGYYTFALTKDGITKDVHAKFTYIYRMTTDGVQILTHNSGITPKGAIPRA